MIPTISQGAVFDVDVNTNNLSTAAGDQGAVAGTSTNPQAQSARPWVTIVAFLICVAVFLGLLLKNDNQNWDTLAMFGYLPATSIWNGAIWALVTSAFVHIDPVHLGANIYWLWVLGSKLEQEIGSLRYLAFMIAAAFVSSAFQLAVSDATGIGLSGVLYAIFGFMWVTRRTYPEFTTVLTTKVVQLFVAWLMICVIITRLNILAVGSTAHFTGLLFGLGVAASFVLRRKSRLTFAALVSLIACSIVPLVWCPWSVTWLSLQAYNSHAAQRIDEALMWYSRIIARDPQNAWAFMNRGKIYEAIGRIHDAKADLEMARKLDPAMPANPQ